MISPVVTEPEWLSTLASLPTWHPGSDPLLVVAPHPDDETLGAGGLIRYLRLRAVDVTVAAVTDGENAYADDPQLGSIRPFEQSNALGLLGVSDQNIVRFGLPDSGLADHENGLLKRLRPLISSQTHVLAPWIGDFHPDHEVCGRAAEKAAQEAGARLSFYFFWSWHRGTVALLNGLSLHRFPLTPDLLQVKLQALACHRSQLHRDKGDAILPELLLGPARRSFEVFLPA